MKKIIVKKRFSVKDKETKKLKFFEVKSTPVELEDNLADKAIASGYAIEVAENELKTANNSNK